MQDLMRDILDNILEIDYKGEIFQLDNELRSKMMVILENEYDKQSLKEE